MLLLLSLVKSENIRLLCSYACSRLAELDRNAGPLGMTLLIKTGLWQVSLDVRLKQRFSLWLYSDMPLCDITDLCRHCKSLIFSYIFMKIL